MSALSTVWIMDDGAKGEVGVGVFMHGVVRGTGKHRDNNRAPPAHTKRHTLEIHAWYLHCNFHTWGVSGALNSCGCSWRSRCSTYAGCQYDFWWQESFDALTSSAPVVLSTGSAAPCFYFLFFQSMKCTVISSVLFCSVLEEGMLEMDAKVVCVLSYQSSCQNS